MGIGEHANRVEGRSIVERAKQQLKSQRGDRVARTIGLAAIGIGAVHLAMPRIVASWIPVGTGLVRMIGIAEIVGGAVLLGARASVRTTEVQRSITIGAPADLLYARWRDPDVIRRIMAPLATVTSDGNGVLRWRVSGRLGAEREWLTRIIEDSPGQRLRWATAERAPIASAGSVEFHQDKPDVGTVVTLRMQLGFGLPKLVPSLLASKVLRRFKSLVETAEIPTLSRNPAARASAFAY
jgi:uncharacterized membrane protein